MALHDSKEELKLNIHTVTRTKSCWTRLPFQVSYKQHKYP
jgi:hypothetical protein